jgi:hypothetical protein
VSFAPGKYGNSQASAERGRGGPVWRPAAGPPGGRRDISEFLDSRVEFSLI